MQRYLSHDLTPFRDLSELQRIMGRCHDILRKEKPHVLDAFDEMAKILFAKIYDEIGVEAGDSSTHKFQWNANSSPQGIDKEISSLFEEAKEKYRDIFAKNDSILVRPPTVSRIVEIVSQYTILRSPLDVKGGTYEAFLKSALPVGKVVGQFFTPKEVVDFAVEAMDPNWTDSICDPACGTGGFLTAVVDKVWQKIEASFDDFAEAQKMKQSYLFNMVHGVDIEPRMVRLAKMNLLVHNAAFLFNNSQYREIIRRHDGLTFSNGNSEEGSKDICLTNPPFGSIETDYKTLNLFQLGRGKSSRTSPILFLERCLRLMKPGGRTAIVVPDPILNGSSTGDVRALIRQEAVVDSVVKLPSETFVPYGSSAESSLLFLWKKPDSENDGSLMAEAKFVGYNRLGEKIQTNDLKMILNLWQRFKKGEIVNSLEPLAFVVRNGELADRLDVQHYWHPSLDAVERTIAQSRYPLRTVRDVVRVKRITTTPAKDAPNLEFHYIGLGNVRPWTGELTYAQSPTENIGIMKAFPEKTLGVEIKGSCQRIEYGDLIFGKLRPYLRKVLIVPNEISNGVCSTEFVVLTPLSSVDPEYLSYVLRSDIVIEQLSHLTSGLGRPRISADELLDAKIPVPRSRAEQQILANMIRTRVGGALKKRQIAQELLEESKTELVSAFSSLNEMVASQHYSV